MKVSELSDKEWKLIYKHLRLQARKFTFTSEDAEDLASDAFTKGYGKIDSFNPPDGDEDKKLRALNGWFNKIMKGLGPVCNSCGWGKTRCQPIKN